MIRKERILIIEDELIVARDIRKALERGGHKVEGVARTAASAFSLLEASQPTLVLIDIFLKGDLTGIDIATQLNQQGIPFIYVSANSNQPVLEAAKSTNPYGFVVKPFREKDLLVSIDIARYRFENEQRLHARPAFEAPVFAGGTSNCAEIVGKCAGMMHVFKLIQQVARFDTSVLLLGETGTGKEGVASCIVSQSARSNKPYIKVNCAALPAGLIESELFGHEKGAFTGALERKAGKFEQAAAGTILLDEVGEMPIDMQAKLLRVLQEGETQRIGSNVVIKTNVRVIASTNRNLEKEVAEGRFRLDLYYRLYVFPILLPPLRERKDDIPLLVKHFLQLLAGKTGRKIWGVDTNVMQQLMAYHWPGNVRELEHLLERSVLLADSDTIHEIQLPGGHDTP